MNLIAIGDLHLTAPRGKDGKYTRGGLSSLIPDHDDFVADLVVRQCLRYAKQQGIRHVVLLGDVCDGTRLSYPAQRALNRILSTNFHFHIILGNHDLESPDTKFGHSLDILKDVMRKDNVTLYETPTDALLDGAPVRFLPWPHAKFSKSRLNFSHVDMAGARQDNGAIVEDGVSSEATIINGHMHTKQTVRSTYIPGSPYQTSFGIKEGQCFAHATFDDGEWSVAYVPLKPRYVLKTIELRKPEDAIEPKPNELIRAIVHPSFGTDIPLKYARVRIVNSETEAAVAALEDLQEGSGLEFSQRTFFNAWAESALSPDEAKAAIRKHKELFP